MNGSDLERAFFESFSPEFTGNILRMIAAECKNSAVECFTFYPQEEGIDLLGGVRRAKVESKARVVAADYPTVHALPKSKQKNGKGNFHTELQCGNCFLTIHKVQYKGTPVRKAAYRDSYASVTTLTLFDKPVDAPPPPEAILYEQLKYGTDPRLPQALAFAVIDFPDKDGKVVHSWNLLSMEQYSSIPSEFISLTTSEAIEDNLNLNLRPDAKQKNRRNDASENTGNQ